MKKPTIYIVIITILVIVICYQYVDSSKKLKIKNSEIENLRKELTLTAVKPPPPPACSFGGVVPCPIGTAAHPVDINLHNKRFDFSQVTATGHYKLTLRDTTLPDCACFINLNTKTATDSQYVYMKVKKDAVVPTRKYVNFYNVTPETGVMSFFQLKIGEVTAEGNPKQNQDVVNNSFASFSTGTNEEKLIGTDDFRSGFTTNTTWNLVYVEKGAIGLIINGGKLRITHKRNAGSDIYRDSRSTLNAPIKVNINTD